MGSRVFGGAVLLRWSAGAECFAYALFWAVYFHGAECKHSTLTFLSSFITAAVLLCFGGFSGFYVHNWCNFGVL